jgi:hypothetical protein
MKIRRSRLNLPDSKVSSSSVAIGRALVGTSHLSTQMLDHVDLPIGTTRVLTI